MPGPSTSKPTSSKATTSNGTASALTTSTRIVSNGTASALTTSKQAAANRAAANGTTLSRNVSSSSSSASSASPSQPVQQPSRKKQAAGSSRRQRAQVSASPPNSTAASTPAAEATGGARIQGSRSVVDGDRDGWHAAVRARNIQPVSEKDREVEVEGEQEENGQTRVSSEEPAVRDEEREDGEHAPGEGADFLDPMVGREEARSRDARGTVLEGSVAREARTGESGKEAGEMDWSASSGGNEEAGAGGGSEGVVARSSKNVPTEEDEGQRDQQQQEQQQHHQQSPCTVPPPLEAASAQQALPPPRAFCSASLPAPGLFGQQPLHPAPEAAPTEGHGQQDAEGSPPASPPADASHGSPPPSSGQVAPEPDRLPQLPHISHPRVLCVGTPEMREAMKKKADEYGVTVAQAADVLDEDEMDVYRIRGGHKVPTYRVLERLVARLGFPSLAVHTVFSKRARPRDQSPQHLRPRRRQWHRDSAWLLVISATSTKATSLPSRLSSLPPSNCPRQRCSQPCQHYLGGESDRGVTGTQWSRAVRFLKSLIRKPPKGVTKAPDWLASLPAKMIDAAAVQALELATPLAKDLLKIFDSGDLSPLQSAKCWTAGRKAALNQVMTDAKAGKLRRKHARGGVYLGVRLAALVRRSATGIELAVKMGERC